MASVLELYDVDSSQRLPRHFLICDFCFWAATATSFRRHDIVRCPQCEQLLSRIPLGDKESFTFTFEKERGVELAFKSGR